MVLKEIGVTNWRRLTVIAAGLIAFAGLASLQAQTTAEEAGEPEPTVGELAFAEGAMLATVARCETVEGRRLYADAVSARFIASLRLDSAVDPAGIESELARGREEATRRLTALGDLACAEEELGETYAALRDREAEVVLLVGGARPSPRGVAVRGRRRSGAKPAGRRWRPVRIPGWHQARPQGGRVPQRQGPPLQRRQVDGPRDPGQLPLIRAVEAPRRRCGHNRGGMDQDYDPDEDELRPPPVERVVPMAPPRRERSTRVGLWVIAGLVVYSALMPWLPNPFGIVLTLLWLYVGLPLAIMLFKDLGKLRRDRLLARHAMMRVSVEDEEVLGLLVEDRPLAQEHLRSWHAWRRWLVAGGVLAASLGVVGFLLEDWRLGLFFAALAWLPFFLRDMYFALHALAWVSPETWRGLSRYDRVAMRFHAGLMSLCAFAVAGGLAWFIHSIVSGNGLGKPWRAALFTLFWGGVAIWIAAFAWRRAREALRFVPTDFEPGESRNANHP